MAVGLLEILIKCWNLEFEQDLDWDVLWKSGPISIDLIYITVKSLYHRDCTQNFSDTNFNRSMHTHVCKKQWQLCQNLILQIQIRQLFCLLLCTCSISCHLKIHFNVTLACIDYLMISWIYVWAVCLNCNKNLN